MLTLERLKSLLTLEEDRGVFLNKVDRGRYKKGQEAGYTVEGYTYITIDRKAYPAHHLVWMWFYGELPKVGHDLDHINMQRNDNRVENLRLVTRSQNMYNTNAHKDNPSGIKNVSFRKDTGKWSVRVSVSGKYKSFGSYDDKELAELVAHEVREKYHGEHVCHGDNYESSISTLWMVRELDGDGRPVPYRPPERRQVREVCGEASV